VVARDNAPDPLSGSSSEDFYDELQERWPTERPSRKRRKPGEFEAKRSYRRKDGRQVTVRGERLDPPDTARLARALLAAQRELAKAQTEVEAQTQKHAQTPAQGEK
jgi:hypothetical protein